MYRLGILTSLHDDDAPQLLSTIDEAISDGSIVAEVPVMICDKSQEDRSIQERIQKVKELYHVGPHMHFLSPSDVDRDLYQRIRQSDDEQSKAQLQVEFGRIYDQSIMSVIRGSKVNSILNVGWMRILGREMTDEFEIPVVNLHPGIPYIGPVGIWTKVMREQAERPLEELMTKPDLDDETIRDMMSNPQYKAGGMLHITTQQFDRGPLASWYEFALSGGDFNDQWREAVSYKKSGDEDKYSHALQNLADVIRYHQVQGEHPLLVLSYGRITHGTWDVRKDGLYINGNKTDGINLTEEVGAYLRERGFSSLIG